MLQVTDEIAIDEREPDETFIRATGPGGQNVNNVATAVQLRFDVRGSAALSPAIRARLERLAGRRTSEAGVLTITARRFRTQERNREDARRRLCELIAQAAAPPEPPRRPTKPTSGSRLRRLAAKDRRSRIKELRRGAPDD